MAYLLDTCTVSDFVKGDESTIKQLKAKSPIQIKVSAITAYELNYGLEKNPRIKTTIREAVLGFLSDVDIMPFQKEESQHAAIIRSNLEKAGQPIGPYDILIASTALAHSLILVTSNEKEFSRIPDLKLENWKSI